MTAETKPATAKKWYLSKTLWAAVLTALITIGEGYLNGWGKQTVAGGIGAALLVLMRQLTAGGFLWVFPLVLAMGVNGCAMTPAQRLNMVAESTYQLKEVAAPAWSGACKIKAEKCVAEGVNVSKDCAPWVSCQAALKRFYEGHVMVQRSIQTAAWWLANDDAGRAQKSIKAAMAGLAAAYELAKAEGLVK